MSQLVSAVGMMIGFSRWCREDALLWKRAGISDRLGIEQCRVKEDGFWEEEAAPQRPIMEMWIGNVGTSVSNHGLLL